MELDFHYYAIFQLAKLAGFNDEDSTTIAFASLKGDISWNNMSPNELRSHTRKIKGKAGFDSSKWAYFHRAAFC